MPQLFNVIDLCSTLLICDTSEPARKTIMSGTWCFETKESVVCICAYLYRLEVSLLLVFIRASSLCGTKKTGRLHWQAKQVAVCDMQRCVAPHSADKRNQSTPCSNLICGLLEVELWRYGFTTSQAFVEYIWFKFYFICSTSVMKVGLGIWGKFDNFVCIINNVVWYLYFVLICLLYIL